MGKKQLFSKLVSQLSRLANGVETLAGKRVDTDITLTDVNAYYWDNSSNGLIPVDNVNRIPFDLLTGIDELSAILLQNTEQFARGYGANNVLLWGARGMGKSSLIKSAHEKISRELPKNSARLILVEINREDLSSLPSLMRAIATNNARFLVFCDDLSFDRDEASYKSLKTMLDGGLEGRPKNVLFYATSNRRHLMPRDMIDNERSTAINPGEAVEEKVSLSDRFGLSLGFHHCDQPTYLTMVRNYVQHYGIRMDDETLVARAIEWSATRGARSGRVAIQFVRHIAGEAGIAL